MRSCKSKRFLVQGFPKTPDDALAFSEQIAPIRGILYFKAEQQELVNACLEAENKARARVPKPDADEEEVRAVAEKQRRQIRDMLDPALKQSHKPWDQPQETPETGQNWDKKTLSDKPGFVVKQEDREISMEESIARRIADFDDEVAALQTHFASSENQTASGIHEIPCWNGGVEKAAQKLRSTIVSIVGPAGSGKDAAATRLCKDQGYKCICVPELLNEAVADDAPEAAAIVKARSLGRTAPAEAAVALIKKAMRAAEGHKFLLDGFPMLTGAGRPYVHDQYFLLERELGEMAKVVHFDAPKEVRQKRCMDDGVSANQFEDMEDEFAKQCAPILSFAGKIDKLSNIKASGTEGATYDSFQSAIASLPGSALLEVWA